MLYLIILLLLSLKMSIFENIPLELRSLPQWIVWDKEKVPYNPFTKQPANINDSETWTTFEHACIHINNYNGIGFVFTDNDPYFGIDLDDTQGDQIALDRQIKIYREFDSYSEISPSGKGLHIIGKGTVPQGRRRSHIEIYSSQRYFTMTGNVYPQGEPKCIQERQSMLMQLWEQMGAGAPATYLYKGDYKERLTDEEVVNQALAAVNSEKFKNLVDAEWHNLYPSQSEADYAYIDIIAFYTQNRKQIERIYSNSKLGNTDKKRKRKDYITWMINKSFDRMLPPLDFDGFKIALESKIIAGSSNGKTTDFDSVNTVSTTVPASTIILPPGLLGEIAQFIYAAAPRPVPEIALAAAIGLMAGVTGRAYNISGTGLNQYIMVLAKTGRGKEAAASGIDKLMNEVRKQVPTADRFRGPGIINSGQALVKHISKSSNCFISILGEFGITLDRISARNANGADKMLYSVLLDLYNKSGHSQTFQPSIYAKQEDNTNVLHSPTVSILGESTPKIFYDVLNEDMISMGLLPRFLIMEYDGNRGYINKDHAKIFPQLTLIDSVSALAAHSESIMHQQKVINIEITKEAEIELDKFDINSTDTINSASNEIIAELWNRAHMKVLRLSGLVAVGINPHKPLLTIECYEWAKGIVQRDIKALSAKFEAGEIGTDNEELKQINEVKRVINEYITRSWDQVKKYSLTEKMHEHKVIPYVYINKRLAATAAFKKETTKRLWQAIKSLCDIDAIREVPKSDLVTKFSCGQRSFIISNYDLISKP